MTTRTATYMGFRTQRYRPRTTSSSVGAAGEGVPRPSTTNWTKAHTSPAAPITIKHEPTTSAAFGEEDPPVPRPTSTGPRPATKPGTVTKNNAAPRLASARFMSPPNPTYRQSVYIEEAGQVNRFAAPDARVT